MRTKYHTLAITGILLIGGCSQLKTSAQQTAAPLVDQADFSVYGTEQPRFEGLRSPIKSRVLDRRFRTKEAMYLANEMNIGGDRRQQPLSGRAHRLQQDRASSANHPGLSRQDRLSAAI